MLGSVAPSPGWGSAHRNHTRRGRSSVLVVSTHALLSRCSKGGFSSHFEFEQGSTPTAINAGVAYVLNVRWQITYPRLVVDFKIRCYSASRWEIGTL